jgi:hypothetical protein
MPKKASTASQKARAAAREGAKYTVVFRQYSAAKSARFAQNRNARFDAQGDMEMFRTSLVAGLEKSVFAANQLVADQFASVASAANQLVADQFAGLEKSVFAADRLAGLGSVADLSASAVAGLDKSVFAALI